VSITARLPRDTPVFARHTHTDVGMGVSLNVFKVRRAALLESQGIGRIKEAKTSEHSIYIRHANPKNHTRSQVDV